MTYLRPGVRRSLAAALALAALLLLTFPGTAEAVGIGMVLSLIKQELVRYGLIDSSGTPISGSGDLTEITETGDALVITSGTGPVPDISAHADLEAIVDNWTMSTGSVSGVSGIAQTGSYSLAGTGAQVQEGYRSRVYDYSGGSGNPTVLTDDQSQGTVANSSATAAAYVTLPALSAAADVGMTFTFVVDAAYELRIVAGSGDTITVGSLTTAAAGYVSSSTSGDTLVLRAISTTKWVAVGGVGTWTGS